MSKELFFGPTMLKKGIFQPKTGKMRIIVDFSILKLVYNCGHNILVTTMIIVMEIGLVLGMLSLFLSKSKFCQK